MTHTSVADSLRTLNSVYMYIWRDLAPWRLRRPHAQFADHARATRGRGSAEVAVVTAAATQEAVRRRRPRKRRGRRRLRRRRRRRPASGCVNACARGGGGDERRSQRPLGPTSSLAAPSAATVEVAANGTANEHASATRARATRAARRACAGLRDVGTGGAERARRACEGGGGRRKRGGPAQ